MVVAHWFLLLGLLLGLSACGPQPAPAGGMGDTAIATTASESAQGPGFLTPTVPPGAFAGQVTPPPGVMGSTATPTAGILPTASATATARAAGSPSAAASKAAGSRSAAATATPTPFQTPTPAPTDTPVPVVQDSAAESIYVNTAQPAAVQRGGTATVQATTTVPGAICTLTVRYRATQSSPAPEFPAHTADANGNVSWSWTVPADVFVGDWPVTVRCQVGLPLGDPNLPYSFGTKLLPVR